MNLIATVDKNWAIGKQGHLLVNIPEDIKLFRMETAGKAAIMGRKTYEQITDRTALIDRYNVVLTRDVYKRQSTGNIEYFLIKERNSYLKRMSHTHLVSLK